MNKLNRGVLSVIGFSLLTLGAACGEPATEVEPEAKIATTSASVGVEASDTPVISEMMGVQIAFLESKIGPARTVEGENRGYEIGGCHLRVHATGGAITGYTVPLTQACSTQALAVLKSEDLPEKIDLTFGEFADARQNAEFKSDCLWMCGNAVDPAVYLESQAPRAQPGVRAGALQVDASALDAADRIEGQIRSVHDEDYLLQTRFNCDGAFNTIAIRELRNVRIEEIEVGYEPIVSCS